MIKLNHHKTINQTKRSEPFHELFYHRYLQSDVIKPEGYHFESLGIVRVRKLKAINALNFYIGIAMAFLAHMTRKNGANALLKSVLEAARPIKDEVQLLYYRIADSIAELLRHAHTGIRDWFKPKRPNQNQLRFRLPA